VKTIGLIGSGAVGTSLARLAVAARLDVVLSNSRGPETLKELTDSLGERARAATPAEAAQAGDVVVSIPLGKIGSVPADALAGRVVLDTTNYYPGRDGQIAELDSNEVTASELVQRHLDRSRVVKAFNNIGSHHIYTVARPHGAPDRSALPIAGDDAAKQTATELLDTLGFDAVDLGPLAETWRSEVNTPVYVMPYLGPLPDGLDVDEVVRRLRTTPGVTITADEVKRLVASATRGPAGGEWPSDTD